MLQRHNTKCGDRFLVFYITAVFFDQLFRVGEKTPSFRVCSSETQQHGESKSLTEALFIEVAIRARFYYILLTQGLKLFCSATPF